MNYIDNLFHFYATTESFEVHRKNGMISPDSICFLGETGQVYTQDSLFGICRERYERLEELTLEHAAKIRDILGIEGPSVNDGVINTISDLVDFLDGFTEEDNLKAFIETMKSSLEFQISAVNKALSDRITAIENELHNDSESLHNAISAINSQIDTIDIRLGNHDTAISSLNTSLAAHIREYNSLKANYDSFKSYAGTKFTAIDSSISSINTSINALQREFIDLDEKFDSVENEVSEVKALLEDAKKLVRDLEDRFGETLAAFEQFKRDINSEMDDFKSLAGAPGGIAPLDMDAKVPSAYLPSYVDDVLEYATKAAFPVTGETGKIYVALDDNLTYRWSGSTYVEISKSLGLGETSATAYPGSKGKKNADDIAAHKADTSNPHNVTKVQLGLDKVNNTSDADKPVSTATQAALDVLDTSLSSHITDKSNPHNVTKEQVGLGNVDNTSDVDKPISSAVQNVLDTKVDKIIGKSLSTNDFTNADKTKLDNSMSIRKVSSNEMPGISHLLNMGDILYNTDMNKYMYRSPYEYSAMGSVQPLYDPDLGNPLSGENLEKLLKDQYAIATKYGNACTLLSTDTDFVQYSVCKPHNSYSRSSFDIEYWGEELEGTFSSYIESLTMDRAYNVVSNIALDFTGTNHSNTINLSNYDKNVLVNYPYSAVFYTAPFNRIKYSFKQNPSNYRTLIAENLEENEEYLIKINTKTSNLSCYRYPLSDIIDVTVGSGDTITTGTYDLSANISRVIYDYISLSSSNAYIEKKIKNLKFNINGIIFSIKAISSYADIDIYHINDSFEISGKILTTSNKITLKRTDRTFKLDTEVGDYPSNITNEFSIYRKNNKQLSVNIPNSSTEDPGLMTATDKIKLDSLLPFISTDGAWAVKVHPTTKILQVNTRIADNYTAGLIKTYNNPITPSNSDYKRYGLKALATNTVVSGEGYIDINFATPSLPGLMTKEDKQKLDNLSSSGGNYTLPIASSTTLGGIKVGTGLNINDGVLSFDQNTLPMADIINPGIVQPTNNIVYSENIFGVSVEGDGCIYTRIPDVTTTQKGLITAADKLKLDGIQAGAQVNSVTSVNGQTGAVVVDSITQNDRNKLDNVYNLISIESCSTPVVGIDEFMTSIITLTSESISAEELSSLLLNDNSNPLFFIEGGLKVNRYQGTDLPEEKTFVVTSIIRKAGSPAVGLIYDNTHEINNPYSPGICFIKELLVEDGNIKISYKILT